MTGANNPSISYRNEYIRELEAEIKRQRKIIDRLNTELENWRIVAMKFGDAFYHNQIPMMVSSYEEGIIIEVNEALLDALGFTRKELLNKSIFDLQIWADPQERKKMVTEIAEQGYVRNRYTEFRMKNGQIGICLLASSLIELDGNRCLISSVLNIDKQIELQKSLELANEKFSKAFNQNLTGMSISRVSDGVYIDVNERFTSTPGYTREEVIGQSVFKLGLWADLKDRQRVFEALMTDGYIEGMEFGYRMKTGEIGYVISSINLIDIEGEDYILATMVDITKRKQAEESLKQSQQLLHQIFNSIPMSILIVSLKDKRIIEVNDRFLLRNKLTREEFTRQEVYFDQLFDMDETTDFVMELLQNHKAMNYEVKYHLTTGEERVSLLSGVKVSWEGEDCLLAVANDITELRHYQKEMARLDNLKLIGQMSAGMAHEIRNPMTSIRGYLELFKMRDCYKNDIDALELMIEEIDRLNELITKFMSLAQDKNADLRPHYLKDAILNLMPLILVDAYQKNIIIETDLQDYVQVMLDQAQIRQLIFNLVRNGLDAMPDGGVLRVSTYQDSDGVNMLIQDQGRGIPADVIGQIGTPFFTTKDEGTGLGLAVCYSIVENHHAKIDLTTGSEGTTFKITFPMILG